MLLLCKIINNLKTKQMKKAYYILEEQKTNLISITGYKHVIKNEEVDGEIVGRTLLEDDETIYLFVPDESFDEDTVDEYLEKDEFFINFIKNFDGYSIWKDESGEEDKEDEPHILCIAEIVDKLTAGEMFQYNYANGKYGFVENLNTINNLKS